MRHPWPALPVLAALLIQAGCGAPPAPAAAAPAGAPEPARRPGLDRAALAERVRGEIRHAWAGYRRHAWGHDELRPIAGGAHDWYGRPFLMTAVDALDTLLLAGLTDEANEAREHIAAHLSFDADVSVQVFEVTIRLLGGLLSAHQMTGDPRLLALADDLGRRLLPAFRSKTGMPYRYVNLRTGAVRDPDSNPAEIGTLLLELGTLGKLTGKSVYYDTAKRAVVELHRRRSKIGLVGEIIDVETGQWKRTGSHVGARIDSYYEYLLKSWRLFGDPDLERMWRDGEAVLERYIADESGGHLWYGAVDMETGRRTATESGALEAFLPAVLALAGRTDRAVRLQDEAFAVWERLGVLPDVFDYRTGEVIAPSYPLRPEIIESAFYLRRLTGDPRYLAMGERFLADLVRCCRTGVGFASLADLTRGEREDAMPSFFLAETLKYLYLLFAPDDGEAGKATDLAAIVFTTEAHPLRRTW